MKKLIAKTTEGREFFHSKTNAFFAPNSSADKMADILNKNKYNLKDGEKWFVYDYDFMQDTYVTQRLYLNKGNLKAAYL